MKLTFDAKGLAEALSLPVRTVQQYASRHPERLPPRMSVPTRKLMWAVADVEDWVNRRRAVSPPALQE